jgi:hypothetical protein
MNAQEQIMYLRRQGLTVGEISDRTKLGFGFVERALDEALGRKWHGGVAEFVPAQNEMHVIGVRVGRRVGAK